MLEQLPGHDQRLDPPAEHDCPGDPCECEEMARQERQAAAEARFDDDRNG